MARVVIVGAGPAGMSAAGVLAQHGAEVTLVDEGAEPGGQAWRRPGPSNPLDYAALLGADASSWRAAHEAFAAIPSERLDHRAATTAWGIDGRELHLLRAGVANAVAHDGLILATGATDRVLPLPGWTLPGVFTLGGAQTLLKAQGCAIGRRVVFVGSSPLLYLAALQYRRMGCEVAMVLDTTPFAQKVAALPALHGAAVTLARGIGYMRALHGLGVPMHHGVHDIAVEGEGHVQGVRFRLGGAERRVACDAIALGFGLRPETQLAELAGCTLRYVLAHRAWFPETDADGRCLPGVYAAGDGCMTGGAEAAAISGRLAAFALLADRGRAVPHGEMAALRRRLARLRRFHEGLGRAFALPVGWARDIADEVPLCRCENVRIGEVRASARRRYDATDVNAAKARTRCGMGRCQGRICGPGLAEIVAAEYGCSPEQAGHLRAQAPIKPLELSSGHA